MRHAGAVCRGQNTIMARSIIPKLFVSLVLAASLGACATTRNYGSFGDKLAVYNQTKILGESFLEGDMERALELFSENFHHDEWGDRSGLEAFFAEAKEHDYLVGAQFDTSNGDIVFEGENAIVYPIGLQAPMGSATIKLTFAYEKPKWLIIGMELEQY